MSIGIFKHRIPFKRELEKTDSVAHFINVNDQTQSNRDC